MRRAAPTSGDVLPDITEFILGLAEGKTRGLIRATH